MEKEALEEQREPIGRDLNKLRVEVSNLEESKKEASRKEREWEQKKNELEQKQTDFFATSKQLKIEEETARQKLEEDETMPGTTTWRNNHLTVVTMPGTTTWRNSHLEEVEIMPGTTTRRNCNLQEIETVPGNTTWRNTRVKADQVRTRCLVGQVSLGLLVISTWH